MLSKLKILALLLLVGLLATALPMVMTPDTTSADSTGLTSPTTDIAFSGNGFEVTPSSAYADADLTAQNIDGVGDRHLYYNYGLNIPAGATIEGIEVRLDWYLDSDNGTNGMSVELSWNGGLNWTTAQTDYVETTTEHTAILGGPADSWNRAWNPGEFSNANFRVRVTCASDDPTRDFYLDWVPLSIYYAPLAWLEVTGNSSMTAGDSNQLTVTARDNEGDVAVNYNGPKILIFSGPSAAPGGLMPTIGGVAVGNSISLTFADGVSVATLVAYRAETTTVDVSDEIIDSTGHGLGLTVNPAATTRLDLAPEGGPAASGIPFTVMVTAQDAYLNVTAGYAGTVRFESTDGVATLPLNYTFTTGDNGVHAFTNGVTLVTSGDQSITVTDTVSGALTDDEIWTVSAATASRLEVTGTATMLAGSANELTITAKDSSGNIDTAYTGLKSLTFSGPGIAPGGQIPTIGGLDVGATISVNFTGGVSDPGTVTLIAYSAQTTTVDVNDGTISSTGYGLNLTVNPAPTTRLDLTPDEGLAISGTPFTVIITAQDVYSNVTPSYAGTATFLSSDNGTGAILPVPYAFSASDNGTHTYTDGVTLVTSGDQTLTASDAILSDTTTWNVGTVGTPDHIVVSPAAATVIAGDNVTYTVEAFDLFNNSLGDVTTSTTFSIVEPGDGGSWTANVYASQFAGTWTVTGDYAGILGTASLTVNRGAFDHYTVTSDNYTRETSIAFTVTVTAYDTYDNIMITDNTTVINMTSSSSSMIFDGNGNGLFGEPGDNVKTLSAGTFDIQAKDSTAAEGITITASDGSIQAVSGIYTMENFRCFIATAAYGTPMAEEIQILRDFRDRYLATNPPGRLFVSLYYSLSPPVARFIAHHDFLRACIRFGLMPVLWLATAALKTTLAQKLAVMALLLTAALISTIWLRRTRRNRLA